MPRIILNDSNIVFIYNALKRCCAKSGRYVERFSKPIHHNDVIIATNAVVMVEVVGFESRYPRFGQLYNDDMRDDADLVRTLHADFFSEVLRVDESIFIADAKYLKQIIGVFSVLKCADNIHMSYDSAKHRMQLFAYSPLDDNISINAIMHTKRRTIYEHLHARGLHR